VRDAKGGTRYDEGETTAAKTAPSSWLSLCMHTTRHAQHGRRAAPTPTTPETTQHSQPSVPSLVCDQPTVQMLTCPLQCGRTSTDAVKHLVGQYNLQATALWQIPAVIACHYCRHAGALSNLLAAGSTAASAAGSWLQNQRKRCSAAQLIICSWESPVGTCNAHTTCASTTQSPRICTAALRAFSHSSHAMRVTGCSALLMKPSLQ
jgi:hypothetical protein